MQLFSQVTYEIKQFPTSICVAKGLIYSLARKNHSSSGIKLQLLTSTILDLV